MSRGKSVADGEGAGCAFQRLERQIRVGGRASRSRRSCRPCLVESARAACAIDELPIVERQCRDGTKSSETRSLHVCQRSRVFCSRPAFSTSCIEKSRAQHDGGVGRIGGDKKKTAALRKSPVAFGTKMIGGKFTQPPDRPIRILGVRGKRRKGRSHRSNFGKRQERKLRLQVLHNAGAVDSSTNRGPHYHETGTSASHAAGECGTRCDCEALPTRRI